MTAQMFDTGEVPQLTMTQRLRIARENAGLDQQKLAELIGVTRNTVSNAESGKVKARKVVINAWALVTNVPATWLITGIDPKDELAQHKTNDDNANVGEEKKGPKTYWFAVVPPNMPLVVNSRAAQLAAA